MTTATPALLEMLVAALDMEQKGRAFYDEAAAGCTSKLGKEIFLHLAADEVVHLERLKRIFASLKEREAWTEDWATLTTSHEDFSEFYHTLLKKHEKDVTPASSELNALTVGIDLERKTAAYYEEHLVHAKDEKVRTFLKRMIAEERGHLAALSDLKLYLTDPEEWSFEMEHRDPDDE